MQELIEKSTPLYNISKVGVRWESCKPVFGELRFSDCPCGAIAFSSKIKSKSCRLLGKCGLFRAQARTLRDSSTLVKKHFDKLKLHSSSSISIGNDLWQQARDSMQTSIYAKFLGKSLSLEQEKLDMADAWQGLGAFTVADLPNGFYYIRCKAQEMQNRLLWNGPWTVAGCILQLYLWSVTF